jgi:hypothetical protein
MMTGRPPRNTAAAELDVPRSIPMMAMILTPQVISPSRRTSLPKRTLTNEHLPYSFILPNDPAAQAFLKLYNLAASLSWFEYDLLQRHFDIHNNLPRPVSAVWRQKPDKG